MNNKKNRLINGVDIVDIDRISSIMDERQDSLVRKLFTDREKTYLEVKNYRKETIAGLFAAKEAVSKAIGTGIGRIGFKDIEIIHDSLGKPHVELSNFIEEEYMIDYIEVSISHEKKYALAFAVGEVNLID